MREPTSTTPVMSADASEGQPYRFKTTTVAELYAAAAGKKEWLVEGLLPMGGSSILLIDDEDGKQ